jgi:hypothetical protein
LWILYTRNGTVRTWTRRPSLDTSLLFLVRRFSERISSGEYAEVRTLHAREGHPIVRSLSLSCSFSSPCLLLTHTLSVSCASLLLTYRCAECRPPWRRSLSYLTSKVPLCLLRHSCGSLTALTAGYTMANNDLPLCREAISILQNYYPERLGPSLSVCGCMYVCCVCVFVLY